MSSVWDDPEMIVASDWVKFVNPGDSAKGKILAVSIHRWEDGSVCPKLTLDIDGNEVGMTASQYQLKAKLAELRPEVGDFISVTFTGIEPRPGGKTAKKFDVDVTRAGSAPATAAPAAPAPAAPTAATPDLNDPAVIAALAALQQKGVVANDTPPF